MSESETTGIRPWLSRWGFLRGALFGFAVFSFMPTISSLTILDLTRPFHAIIFAWRALTADFANWLNSTLPNAKVESHQISAFTLFVVLTIPFLATVIGVFRTEWSKVINRTPNYFRAFIIFPFQAIIWIAVLAAACVLKFNIDLALDPDLFYRSLSLRSTADADEIFGGPIFLLAWFTGFSYYLRHNRPFRSGVIFFFTFMLMAEALYQLNAPGFTHWVRTTFCQHVSEPECYN